MQHAGQVYIPFICYLLGGLCVLIIATFQTSARMTRAYGLAVLFDMLITTHFFTMVRFGRTCLLISSNPVCLVTTRCTVYLQGCNMAVAIPAIHPSAANLLPSHAQSYNPHIMI